MMPFGLMLEYSRLDRPVKHSKSFFTLVSLVRFFIMFQYSISSQHSDATRLRIVSYKRKKCKLQKLVSRFYILLFQKLVTQFSLINHLVSVNSLHFCERLILNQSSLHFQGVERLIINQRRAQYNNEKPQGGQCNVP